MTPTDDRRSEPMWRWDAIETLRREQQDGHRRLRNDFERAQQQDTQRIKELDQTVDQLVRDVITIKTQRDMEGQQLIRRNGSIALVVSAGVTILLRLLEVFFK